MTEPNVRNYAIDVLRLMCAFLVILLHAHPNSLGFISPITRCAVPIFFIISGFFLASSSKIDISVRKSLKKIIYILLWSSLFFFFFTELLTLSARGKFFLPNIRQWVYFLCFNENPNPFAYHLWYLAAYVYVLILLLIVDKLRIYRLACILIPILFAVDVLFGKYSLLFFDRSYNYVFYRNFIFVAFPCTMLGYVFGKNKSKLIILDKVCKKMLTKSIMVVLCILFSITSCVEKKILISNNVYDSGDCFISTIFLSMSFFFLAVNTNFKESNFLSEWGRKYSLMIYIVHPIFLFFCRKIIHSYEIIIPIVVFIASLFFSIMFYNIKTKFFLSKRST